MTLTKGSFSHAPHLNCRQQPHGQCHAVFPRAACNASGRFHRTGQPRRLFVEQLPAIKPYLFKQTGLADTPATLREALCAAPWDFNTFQQVSDMSFRPETYFPFLQSLYDLARTLAPQAQIVLYQTWAYRVDAPDLAEYGLTQTQMHAQLTAAYDTAARTLGCRVLPVGDAFARARVLLGYHPDPTYDFAHATPYALPCQTGSLIAGYDWATGNTASGHAELQMDGRHGNALGCYLAAAVWYEMFTGLSIGKNPFCPAEITKDAQAVVQLAARQAMQACGGPLGKE
ncbi:MAG: DUF4886 domain-containing protein [Clostridia bacterium]